MITMEYTAAVNGGVKIPTSVGGMAQHMGSLKISYEAQHIGSLNT